MSTIFTLPPLDDTTSELTVERYYCVVEQTVQVGQPLVMIRSDRFVWDVPASASGTLSAIVAQPGTTVAAGAPLAEIKEQEVEDSGQESEGGAARAKNQEPKIENQMHGELAVTAQRPIQNPKRGRPLGTGTRIQNPPDHAVRATPLARKIAAAHALELGSISGTGYGGSITQADVLEVIGGQRSAVSGQGLRGGGVRVENGEPSIENQESIAAAQRSNAPTLQRSNVLASSLQPPVPSAPYALTAMEVDLGEALALLQAHQARAARRGIELSVTACVAFAVVAALGKHRMLNSAWSDDGIILRSRVHVLVEQTMQRDTHTLLLTDAADLSLLGMARRLAEVGQQGNGQRYDVEPTFAINERATPWWGHTLPGTYTAQLTIGVPQHRPKVVETTNGDQIVVRPTMLLMLAYDARVLAQPEVDTFLADVKQQLEHLRSL